MDDQLKEYEVGPVQFSGGADALYERHLIFDDVIAVEDAGLRERRHPAHRLLHQRLDVLEIRR